MTDTAAARREVLNEIENRARLGGKKSHSESSLQQFGEDEAVDISPTDPDPGVSTDSFITYFTI